jgi:hypothetical protein
VNAGSDAPRHAPSAALRLLGGVGGVLVLLLGALFTLGTALVAPLGMLAARILARRKGRPTTRTASWIGACVASSAVILVGALTLYLSTSPETIQGLEAAQDSAQANARAHPPAWVESMRRVAPPNPAAERVIHSHAVTQTMRIIGGVIAVEILGIIAGSAGWLGTALILYALQRPRPDGTALRSS